MGLGSNLLEQSGFQEDKLNLVRRFLQLEQCDMLDVLSYLAYNTTPLDRQRRADIIRAEMEATAPKSQQDFADFILKLYVDNGFKELDMDKLPTLIDMKYHSVSDARQLLGMDAKQIRNFFLDFQHELYNGPAIRTATA